MKPDRLSFIDWTRGLGAAIMLQGHAFHSFTHPSLRESAPFIYSQFVGGMPPAIFLFLTGVTLAFLMDSMERKGLGTGQRILGALKRSRYLFLLAFGFRLQMFLFGWPRPWEDIFKVDVLNCMGFSVAVLSLMTLFPTAERARLSAALGFAIAVATPVIAQLEWTGWPSVARQYLAPDGVLFGFFPWAAFLAFGLAVGSAIRLTQPENLNRLLQWLAVGGFVVIYGSQYASNLPFSLYTKSEFWIDSPWLVFIKTGICLLLLAAGWVWTQYIAKPGWSWIRQLGTTSLLVYWVHVELVYGRWFWYWKENLTIPQASIMAVLVILLMVALSYARTNWDRLKPAWVPDVLSFRGRTS
ncbi:MAG: hypothetical protein K2X03_22090 [Bryobacteraceae bacterium]|nr:hypothetical protein [Bryobacteraceae bacterium]